MAQRAGQEPTGQQFYQQYGATLKTMFKGLATESELLHLVETIVDHHHLEVDYNHYFRPERTPLVRQVYSQQGGSSLSRIKNDLIYPLLRFVLPRTTPAPAVNGSGSVGERIAARAFAYLGVPYGAPSFNRQTGQGTLDCSGLVNYVFNDIGLHYRRGGGQSAVQGMVSSPDLVVVTAPRPGDLLVRKHKNNQWSHVGIYVGNQQLIEAPYSGTVVRVTPYKPAKWHRIIRYNPS